MKHTSLSIALGFLFLGGFVTSCSKDETTKPLVEEFVATDADFANFTTWEMIGTPLRGRYPAGCWATLTARWTQRLRERCIVHKPEKFYEDDAQSIVGSSTKTTRKA